MATDFNKIRSREARVNFICGIGGYYCRDGRWPIEFSVPAWGAELGADEMWERYKTGGEFPIDTVKKPELAAELKSVFMSIHKANESTIWDAGVEDAQFTLFESDAYSYLRDGKTTVDVEFGLYGRGGKHLVIKQLCGIGLFRMTEEELYDKLMSWTRDSDGKEGVGPKKPKGAEWDTPTRTVNQMFEYLTQATEWFTPDTASREVEHGADFRLAQLVNDAWDQYLTTRADEEEKLSMAADISRHIDNHSLPELQEKFTKFCAMVNVSVE